MDRKVFNRRRFHCCRFHQWRSPAGVHSRLISSCRMSPVGCRQQSDARARNHSRTAVGEPEGVERRFVQYPPLPGAVPSPSHFSPNLRSTSHRGAQLWREPGPFHPGTERNRLCQNQHVVCIRSVHRYRSFSHSSRRTAIRRILGSSPCDACGNVFSVWRNPSARPST